MTEQVKMAKGYLWNDTAEYLEEQRIHQEWAYDFNQTRPSETAKREELLRKIFGQVGKNVFVRPPVTIARGSLVSIGDETYINSNLTIVDDYKITIGKNCLFAPNVTMSTTGHPVHPVYSVHPPQERRSACIRVRVTASVWLYLPERHSRRAL